LRKAGGKKFGEDEEEEVSSYWMTLMKMKEETIDRSLWRTR
jgi:hypothetical protein